MIARNYLWLFLMTLLCGSTQVLALEDIELTLPSQVDGGHAFYHELLYQSLQADGYKVIIEIPKEHIPQKRAKKMVSMGQLSLTWLIATAERNKQFVPVRVPLTNGLIGKRVALIPPELQTKFDSINNLKDLKNSGLIAGMGINWFDVDVWQSNQLPVYIQDGEWRSLYSKLTSTGFVNYFPRGMIEVLNEAKQNPHLAVEQRLLLVYQKDFYFYLSPQFAHYQSILEKALLNAQQSGLMERLVKKYWQTTFEQLKPEGRVVIELALPEHGSQ
ncbi:hypothetical protein QWZ16_09305 [Vibrio ostreicida]|uniref:Solute-binding protein family 3/N-terminal domain-containing protein n=2 Tax=Vibrio ostreicida TaxID=526588 RepID=A0ABT8BT90_9VIBR|nr:hypothetical protein [Vibrio ostreicida]MDN3609894.1 hypothetical protein [Vibrio ostreicida]